MKLMQSRFYKPRKILSIEGDGAEVKVIDDEYYYRSRSNPFESVLDNILSGIYLSNSELVISEHHLQDFERCTDFYSVKYNKNTNQSYASELCYFHPTLEIFVLADTNLSDEYDKHIMEDGLLRVSNVYYESSNPDAPANIETLLATYLQKYQSNDAKVSILLKDTDGLVFKTQRIKPRPIDLELMYNDDFLPVHKHIKDRLTHHSKGVLLLHGVAGSGKTNYIKWLTAQVPNKQFVFVPTNMINSLTDPGFMSLLIDNKNAILVLEDCENYIAERTVDDVNTDVVASILNIADGMLSDILECQFICTFNSDLSKVDSALLRKGRLIAEYQFAPLTTDKANAYLRSIGHEQRVSVPATLAELTNMDENSYKAVVKETKIGFV
ncbi:AAA family ATPase [Psychrobacter aestuarii]|uniref:ATPase AAA-type core domain-containing protein n=1 Tax=Psychrobacter aestuarii TaxID=556327 RepID=A0ABN0VN31_9GAMM|nr:AAA family ATPase [Psychrobacter aestuarii]